MTNNIFSIIEKFTSDICNEIENNLSEIVDINVMKNSDGRKRDAPIYCKNGSFIYYAYDKLNNIIYIGESGESVRTRFFGDGSGSHYRKDWFNEVSYVKYYKNDSMDNDTRKLIERVLILKYRETYKLYNGD